MQPGLTQTSTHLVNLVYQLPVEKSKKLEAIKAGCNGSSSAQRPILPPIVRCSEILTTSLCIAKVLSLNALGLNCD